MSKSKCYAMYKTLINVFTFNDIWGNKVYTNIIGVGNNYIKNKRVPKVNYSVQQFDKNNVYIRTFDKLSDAVIFIKNKWHKTYASNIKRVCYGKQKSAYGYI